jgi:hypothetical protein
MKKNLHTLSIVPDQQREERGSTGREERRTTTDRHPQEEKNISPYQNYPLLQHPYHPHQETFCECSIWRRGQHQPLSEDSVSLPEGAGANYPEAGKPQGGTSEFSAARTADSSSRSSIHFFDIQRSSGVCSP